MHFTFISSIFDIDAHAWDALWPTSYPFGKHAFFAALERSGSTTRASGWQAMHCIGFEGERLAFVMPLFLKTHSYGEYVFDWGWADAYHRAGLEYYPKLLNAIPFTPATGPRWAAANNLDANTLELLWCELKNKAASLKASGIHSLFPSAPSSQFFESRQCIQRHGCQYHWFNQNYACFDDFLSNLSSRKRKNIKKERAKCSEFKVTLLHGNETTKADWHLFYSLYHRTYLKRSGRPGYLTESFFTELAHTLGEQMILALVEHKGERVAGAVYFKDEHCLYGRYWGALNDIDGLHFETCYYQGIEYAIAHKLTRFDPGAQGEHKIQRGFQPVLTQSYHWLSNPQFHAAVADFCYAEGKENTAYIEHARTFLPFKEGHALCDIHAITRN